MYNKSVARKHGSNIFSLLLIIIVIAALVGGGLVYYKNGTLPFLDQKSNTPEKPHQYKEQLLWIPYVLKREDFILSMEIPYSGPFCSRCRESTTLSDQSYQVGHITGGYFAPQSQKHWILTTAVSAPGIEPAPAADDSFMITEGLLANDFYFDLSQIPQGGKAVFRDKYTFERLGDIEIDGVTAMRFKTTLYAAYMEDLIEKNLAAFQKDGTTVFIAFEYNNTLYADEFDHILKTAKFSDRKTLDPKAMEQLLTPLN